MYKSECDAASQEEKNERREQDKSKASLSCVTSNNEKEYRDFANVSPAEASSLFGESARPHNPHATGLQQQGFAVKLHYMLSDIEASGDTSIVSWQPHGRCFVVHDRQAFVERILPSYFMQSTFASFQRQCNLYGFQRISSSKDKGGYYHELFLRSKPELVPYIQRIKRKGNGPRRPDDPEREPDFYSMPSLPSTSKNIAPTPEENFSSPRDYGDSLDHTYQLPHNHPPPSWHTGDGYPPYPHMVPPQNRLPHHQPPLHHAAHHHLYPYPVGYHHPCPTADRMQYYPPTYHHQSNGYWPPPPPPPNHPPYPYYNDAPDPLVGSAMNDEHVGEEDTDNEAAINDDSYLGRNASVSDASPTNHFEPLPFE